MDDCLMYIVHTFHENIIGKIKIKMQNNNDNFSNISRSLIHSFFSALSPVQLSLYELLRQRQLSIFLCLKKSLSLSPLRAIQSDYYRKTNKEKKNKNKAQKYSEILGGPILFWSTVYSNKCVLAGTCTHVIPSHLIIYGRCVLSV